MERTWRVGHQGRDQMYYEEMRGGVWERIDIDGEMLMGRAHHAIYFATPERWQQYPEWARGRRDEIIARIRSEFRAPDYEYQGGGTGGARAKAPPPATGMRVLLVVVVLLFVIAGTMGWLVTRGVVRGETYYPTQRPTLRRPVSRQQEPGMFWLSIGVYAVIAAGTLTLGVLGVRAGRRA